MTKVGKRLLAVGIVLAWAGSVSQVLGAEVRPDPLLSIDQNRPVVIERIVEVFRPAFGAGQEATVRQALAGMRADHLLAASLAPSLDGLLAVLKSAESSSVALAEPVRKALGDVAKDLTYTPVTPCRIVDTRFGAGGTLNAGSTRNWLAANPSGTFVAQGGSATNCGIPVKPAAVLVNLTVAGTQSGPAFLTAWPFNQAKPLAASLNWVAAGTQVANAIILPLCTGGGCTSDWSLYASSGTELIVDVMGYFAAPTGGYITGTCPAGKAVRSVNTDGSVVCEALTSVAGTQALPRPQYLSLGSAGQPGVCTGGFTDLTHGYMPCGTGRLVRVSLDNFSAAGVTGLDLTTLNTELKNFRGGFTDGGAGYLVPSINGLLTRVSLQNFSTAGVTFIDLAAVDPALKWFNGGFTDGRYGYLVPGTDPLGSASHGKVTRVDLWQFCASSTCVAVLDLVMIAPELKGFRGGFIEGRYGYLVHDAGKLVRIDLRNFTASGVTVLDFTQANPGVSGFHGGFSDGRYGYMIPFHTTKVARVDLQDFSLPGISIVDLASAVPFPENTWIQGYGGGFAAGRYVYFAPQWYSPGPARLLVRIDTTNFTSDGVEWIGSEDGYTSGFSNGRHGMFVPYDNLRAHSTGSDKVMRIQLQNGAGAP